MSTELNPPLPGMTVIPYDYGTEIWDYFQGGAWLSLCQFLLSKPEARAAFKEATGRDLSRLEGRSPIVQIIDQSSGFEQSVMAAWCDWVTVHHWGVAGQCVEIDLDDMFPKT